MCLNELKIFCGVYVWPMTQLLNCCEATGLRSRLILVVYSVRTSQFPEPGSLEKFWMYITAFASISSNRNRGSFDSEENLHCQSGIDIEEKILFCVQSHVFAGEEFASEDCTNSYD